MRGHECYHCKQWIDEGVEHDCWTTTEAALTRDLSDDLRDAWERLRETAADFGEQRIYASHKSIMFSRRACYFFVRPRRRDLEVTFFVGRLLKSGRIRRSRSHFATQDRPRRARHASRRGRGAVHRLAAGSLRVRRGGAGDAKGRDEEEDSEEEDGDEAKDEGAPGARARRRRLGGAEAPPYEPRTPSPSPARVRNAELQLREEPRARAWRIATDS